jgi:hypothetical protein
MNNSILTTTDNISIVSANNIVPNSFLFYVGDECMLKIAKDGFYVRGKRVKQDDNEAETVYNAFMTMLSYHTLTR